MHSFIWCLCAVYICAHRPCQYHQKKKTGIGSRAPLKNNHARIADHQPTWVLFQDHLFPGSRQVLWITTRSSHGGSPINPIVANLYMEDFEIKAINSAEQPHRIWKRYVDNTFVVIESAKKEQFLEHINKMDTHIQFTTEDAKVDGSIPFLDTIVMPQSNNSLLSSVYSSPHNQIYTCSGTVIIICQLSAV